MPDRPPIDIVIPFRGTPADLAGVLATVRRLELRPDDRAFVADNTPGGTLADARGGEVAVVRATARRSSYFARNAGAAAGRAPWIVFLDADVVPAPGLLDAYFRREPGDRAAVLVGAIEDEYAPPHAPPAARYAALRRPMRQPADLGARWAYAQTANCAVRRAAFDAVGGFDATVRSGGDADLCFRLRAAGWTLEARTDARVTHANRRRVRDLLRQRARHGAGAAWLDAAYPGAFPPAGARGLAAWTARRGAAAAAGLVRRDRDRAIEGALDVLTRWAFELGRRASNEAPRG